MADYRISYIGDNSVGNVHHIGVDYNGNYYSVIFGRYILQMLCVCSYYLIRWWAMGLEPILTSVGSFRFTRLALVFLRQGNASLRICTHHENLNLLVKFYPNTYLFSICTSHVPSQLSNSFL